MGYKEVAGGICAPKGFAAAGVCCGIRAGHTEKYDLAQRGSTGSLKEKG